MKPGTIVICFASNVCVLLPIEPLDVRRAADGDEPAGLHRERLGARRRGVHRVDLGVEHDEVGVRRRRRCGSSVASPSHGAADRAGDAGAGQAHESSAAVAILAHVQFPYPLLFMRKLIRDVAAWTKQLRRDLVQESPPDDPRVRARIVVLNVCLIPTDVK